MMMIYRDHLKGVLCVQHGACVSVWLRFGFSLITFLIGTKPPSLHTFLNHSHLYNIDTNRQTKLSMILLLTIFIARMQNCNSGFGLMNNEYLDRHQVNDQTLPFGSLSVTETRYQSIFSRITDYHHQDLTEPCQCLKCIMLHKRLLCTDMKKCLVGSSEKQNGNLKWNFL